MAGKLPAVDGKRVVRALTRAGFVIDRVTGSHHMLVFPGDPARAVTVPVHAGRDLKPGTLRSIIRQAGFSVEEFNELLQRCAEVVCVIAVYTHDVAETKAKEATELGKKQE